MFKGGYDLDCNMKNKSLNPSFRIHTASGPDFRVAGGFNALKAHGEHSTIILRGVFCYLLDLGVLTWLLAPQLGLGVVRSLGPPPHFLCMGKYFSFPHGLAVQVEDSHPCEGHPNPHSESMKACEVLPSGRIELFQHLRLLFPMKRSLG